MTCKKPVVAKGEILKFEHVQASHLADKDRNPEFGFRCLHYSVSEGSGHIRIYIENKLKQAKSIIVRTIDAEAVAGEDFEGVDELIHFKNGQAETYIEIKIFDDDAWEPDEDFYIQLYDVLGQELPGRDTRTTVTIIDDDKPGFLCFQEENSIQADATQPFVEVVVVRKSGADGKVTVEYETVQLDDSPHTATPGVDYEEVRGTLVFEHLETVKSVNVPIIPRELEEGEQRNELFGFQLKNVTPEGAKLSKKKLILVNIVTNLDSKKKQEAMRQLMKQIEDDEEVSWK